MARLHPLSFALFPGMACMMVEHPSSLGRRRYLAKCRIIIKVHSRGLQLNPFTIYKTQQALG